MIWKFIIFMWLAVTIVVAHSQTAQDSVERTIGSLVVQNATCAAQGLATAEELRRVKAELAELKVKQPVEPRDVSPLRQ